MDITLDFSTYAQWSAYATLAVFLLSVIGFVTRWGIRFRLVGITGFMLVLTGGLFGLGLGLFSRVEIPGSRQFSLVYDNGGNSTVISLPNDITPSELEATLQQAANDLFSYGRTALGGKSELSIRARTLIHPEPGVSKPLYIGQIKRSLANRDDATMEIEIFEDKLAQLQQKSK